MDGKLNDSITWWSTPAPDGFGGDKFGNPVLITGRWEDRQEKYIGQLDRQEKISNAVVFIDRDVAVGDYLCRGDQTASVDPSIVVGAYKIEKYNKTPDLRSLNYVRRAVL